MSKTDILKELIRYYTDGNQTQFALILGVAPTTVSSWLRRNTFDIDILRDKCVDINPAWLLTGEGNMLLSEHSKTESKSNNNEEVEYWRERCKDAEAEVMRLRGQIEGLETALRIIKGDVPSLKSVAE